MQTFLHCINNNKCKVNGKFRMNLNNNYGNFRTEEMLAITHMINPQY